MEATTPTKQMEVNSGDLTWQKHFFNRTMGICWWCFGTIVLVYLYVQQVVHDDLKLRLPWYYWTAKQVVFACAAVAAILSTVLDCSILGLGIKYRHVRPTLFASTLPIKWILTVALLLCVLVNFVLMLAAAVVALGYLMFYTPAIFKLVKGNCFSNFACATSCTTSDLPTYCCAQDFDQANEKVFQFVAKNFSAVFDVASDLPKSFDLSPDSMASMLNFAQHHTVSCVSGEAFDAEEAFATNAKGYAISIAIALLVASLLYNSAFVYVFEVQAALFWDFCKCCRRHVDVQAREPLLQ